MCDSEHIRSMLAIYVYISLDDVHMRLVDEVFVWSRLRKAYSAGIPESELMIAFVFASKSVLLHWVFILSS